KRGPDIGPEERQIHGKRIIVARVGSPSQVLKSSVKDSVAKARDHLRRELPCQAGAWPKIGERRIGKARHTRIGELDPILCQQGSEGRGKSHVLARGVDHIFSARAVRSTGIQDGIRTVFLPNLSKELPAQTEIQSEFRGQLPVVLEIGSVVVANIVDGRYVGGKHSVRPTDVIDPVWDGRSYGRKEQVSHSHPSRHAGNPRVSSKVHLATGPSGVGPGETNRLKLKASLKIMLAVNLG